MRHGSLDMSHWLCNYEYKTQMFHNLSTLPRAVPAHFCLSLQPESERASRAGRTRGALPATPGLSTASPVPFIPCIFRAIIKA